jgi:DNA-binding transcriptional LysR family regulator
MSQIQQEFADDVSKDVRPFQFATGVTTLIHQLGGPLREVRKRFPNADIGVTVGVTEEIVAGLLERRFDLGLISLPVFEQSLEIMPLFDEELLVLRPSPNSVRSSRTGVIQAADLANVPFLLYPKPSNIRHIIDQFFQEINVTPRVVMEAEDSEAIKGLVESGFGYSILPQHALRGRNRFFPDLPGGGTSSESKPGAGHGPHRLSPQVDGIDRRVATEDSDQPVIPKLDASHGRGARAPTCVLHARLANCSKFPRNRRFTSRWMF